MKQVTVASRDIFLNLIEKAYKSQRRRAIYCLHETADNMLHSMINVILKDSYIAPHKHWLENNNAIVKKGESYSILEWKAKILLFDDNWNITQTINLTPEEQTVVLVPEWVWHTIVALSEHIIIFENKTWPWVEWYDKVFHPSFPLEWEQSTKDYVIAWSTSK